MKCCNVVKRYAFEITLNGFHKGADKVEKEEKNCPIYAKIRIVFDRFYTFFTGLRIYRLSGSAWQIFIFLVFSKSNLAGLAIERRKSYGYQYIYLLAVRNSRFF